MKKKIVKPIPAVEMAVEQAQAETVRALIVLRIQVALGNGTREAGTVLGTGAVGADGWIIDGTEAAAEGISAVEIRNAMRNPHIVDLVYERKVSSAPDAAPPGDDDPESEEETEGDRKEEGSDPSNVDEEPLP